MNTTRAILRKSVSLMLLGALLTSCYSYKPYLNDTQIRSEILQEKIVPGKKYEVLIIGEKEITIKVDSVGSDRLKGDASWTVSNRQSKYDHSAGRITQTVHQKNYSILFEQIKSVRERKVSTGKTIAAIVVPVGILALIGVHAASSMLSGMTF